VKLAKGNAPHCWTPFHSYPRKVNTKERNWQCVAFAEPSIQLEWEFQTETETKSHFTDGASRPRYLDHGAGESITDNGELNETSHQQQMHGTERYSRSYTTKKKCESDDSPKSSLYKNETETDNWRGLCSRRDQKRVIRWRLRSFADKQMRKPHNRGQRAKSLPEKIETYRKIESPMGGMGASNDVAKMRQRNSWK
jgi:hypothetical protein